MQQELNYGRTLSNLQRSRFYFKLLKNNRKSLDDLLLASVREIREVKDLYIVALTLREGANPNIYVQQPKELFERHLVIHTLSCLKENHRQMSFDDDGFNAFVSFVLVLLFELGANFSLPAYRQKKNDSIDPDFIISAKIRLAGLSDREMASVDSNVAKLTGGQLVEDLRTLMKPELSKTMSLMLNRPDPSIKGSFLFEDILLARADRVYSVQSLAFKNSGKMAKKAYTQSYYGAIKACEKEIFEDLLANGVPMTYFDVAFLIVMINHDEDLIGDYFQMLLTAVRYGVPLDDYQVKSIQRHQEYLVSVREEYAAPYINKLQRSQKGLIPSRMAKIAFCFSISIDRRRAELGQILKQISDTPFDVVEKTFVERYQTKLSSQLLPFLTFQEEVVPVIKIANRETLIVPPEIINDYQSVTFEGPNGEFYSFTSEYFDNLLKNKKVPIAGEMIPVPFVTLSEIRGKIEVLRHYRVPRDNIITIDNAYNDLVLPEEITNKNSNRIIESVKILLKSRGVNNLERKSNDKVVDYLSDLSYAMSDDELSNLDNLHVYALLYYAIYRAVSENRMDDFESFVGNYFGN